MNSIGGYFELELKKRKEYHNENVLRLNTGRNALEYILRVKEIEKIYIPFYSCDAILEPLVKLNIKYEFYHIDKKLNPIFKKEFIQDNEAFLFINYFGIKYSTIKDLVFKFGKKIIIDNTQAFFSKPFEGIDTFYSVRKFFGVPDGTYLYIDKFLNEEFEQDTSLNRIEHLFGRIDLSTEEFYNSYIDNEKSLIGLNIKYMSKLTQRILESIDYEFVSQVRLENFTYIHSKLKSTNRLSIDIKDDVPMIYPYLIGNGYKLKETLIKNRIYVATYWPNVKKYCKKNSFERELVDNLVAIPIDQRYSCEEMRDIISIINKI